MDGKEAEFSALLLRDLCQCPACVHESTNQKLYSTADIPPEIEARSIQHSASTPDSITLKWNSDAPGFGEAHETVLSLDTLRCLQSTGALPGPFQDRFEKQDLWGAADQKPPDTTFKDYLGDDEAVYKVMKQLRTHGLVFITEIPHLEDALQKIATRMGPMKDTFYGYTWDGLSLRPTWLSSITDMSISSHRSLCNQCSIYLRRSWLPHRLAILPKSTTRPTAALHPVFLLGWSKRLRRCLQISRRPLQQRPRRLQHPRLSPGKLPIQPSKRQSLPYHKDRFRAAAP